jgi:hypothetical protein
MLLYDVELDYRAARTQPKSEVEKFLRLMERDAGIESFDGAVPLACVYRGLFIFSENHEERGHRDTYTLLEDGKDITI